MSADRPKTVNEMISWLKAHPHDPFYSIYGSKRLIIGTRNDEGELSAYDCAVLEHAWELAPRPAPSPSADPEVTKP